MPASGPGASLPQSEPARADPLARRREADAAPTVNAALDRFFGEYAPRRIADGRMSDRTFNDYRKQANLTIRPALGKLKVPDVTRADIERAVAKRAPVQRNRTLALLSRLFNLFEAWEIRPLNTNPVRRIERAREEPRDRVLAPSEIAALNAALDGEADPFAVAAIRFLAMTGWRTGEALAIRWENVNFETAEITLPATKTGRANRPVGAAALEILASLPRIDRNPYAFAGARQAAIGYRKLRMVFARACKAAGLPDTRLHDLRRSVATAAAAHGLSPFLLRDLLGHRTTAMADRYARRAGSALQAAVEASADRMAAFMDGESGEVVRFEKKG